MRCDTCLHNIPAFLPSPITPPAESSPVSILNTAVTILRSQSLALSHLTDLYLADPETQNQYVTSIQLMHNALLTGGKIVLTGMGKSGKIADKLVATMNSLGIHAATLHPCDALHGDLGVLRPADVLVMITSSGNTPELNQLLPYLPAGLPRICLTCTPNSPLGRGSAAVLSAHLPGSLLERAIYGVPAPTTSTTACLAVGDAVCITLSEIITAEQEERKKNFGRWHPGGAIGNDYKKDEQRPMPVQDVMVPWTDVSLVDSTADELEILRAAAGRLWVCVGKEKLVKAHELGKSSYQAAGVAIDILRRVGPTDEVATVGQGEIVLVVKDMNNIIGVYQGK
ncbi:hypothetical protein V1525DRAFT_145473 [Lipomyces kononenkoae]|uniref:Uncharacterized protein n=1 Tax=Lipomyces kononenkoae TaxID=34357 RepID=A0ACC3T2Z8_LIPKO